MIDFLTTLQTATQIEQIVRGATKEITLVSPYLQLSRDLGERLLTAEEQGASVRLIYGKKRELQEETRKRLGRLSRLELLYYHNLHAKCYYNEEKLVLTSMNLYEYSARNNREMGVLTTADEDLYRSARQEVEGIARQAEALSSPGGNARAEQTDDAQDRSTTVSQGEQASGAEQETPGGGGIESALSALFSGGGGKETQSGSRASGENGFCIRCQEHIDYDPERPLCRQCYRKWADWEDPEYEENYCHRCGREAAEARTSGALSMERPECLSCYRERRAGEKQQA